MAFVNWVLNNPGYAGVEDPKEVGVENRPNPPRLISSPDSYVRIGDLELTMSPVFNPDNASVNGWQVFGGGQCPECPECPECPPGGSARPTTGVLYPRGQG